MPHCTLLLLINPWRCETSSFCIQFRINSIDSHRPHFSEVRAPSTEKFWCLADNSLYHAGSITAQMLLFSNRILMMNFEHMPYGSNTGQTKDRTILWVIFAGNSRSFPPATMRPSVSTYQFSPKILDDWSSASIIITTLICLPLGFVTWPHRRSLSTSSIWIHLCWWCFKLFLDFDCFLRCPYWFEEVVHVEVPLNNIYKNFNFFRFIFCRHVMQSEIAQFGKLFAPKIWLVYS